MPLPPVLQHLRLPVICAPMFIAGNPKLVIEQCKSGVVGSFPALNARPKEALDAWLTEIETAIAAHPGAAPFAVNQICHKSNDRLEHDIEVCIRHKVPITITSLRAPNDVIPKIHAYGGIVLSGAISSGASILASQAAGADLAYIGTSFLATLEASVPDSYKEELLRSSAADIIYTDLFSGANGNYLKHSVVAAGFDPLNLPRSDPAKMNFGTAGGAEKKVWRDIWSAGQGVGQIDAVAPVAQVVDKLAAEYLAARQRLQIN